MSILAINTQEGAASPAPTPQQVEDSIRRTVELLHGSTFTPNVVELRVLSKGAPLSGFFTDAASLAKAAATIDAQERGNLYVTLNQSKPKRGTNRGRALPVGRGGATGAEDVTNRRWILIDIDSERPKGVNASESEREAVHVQMEAAQTHFARLGWPQPLRCSSGNGEHMLFRVDLPNTPASTELINAVLMAADKLFSNAQAHIDTSVGDAPRITRLYGSKNLRGPHSIDRPQRRSEILSAPEVLEPVTVAQLMAFAGVALTPPPAGSSNGDWNGSGPRFDMEAFLAAANIPARAPVPYNGGTKWVLECCPFNPEHNRGECAVWLDESGAPCSSCYHNNCESTRGWVKFERAIRLQLAEDTAAIAAIDALEAREGYSNTAEGLFQVTRGGAQRVRLGSKLDVVARVRDVDSAGWGFLLRWTAADGRMKDLVVSAGELFGDSRAAISKMVDAGYSIELKRGIQEALVAYINSATPPVELRVDRPGWHSDNYIFPDELIRRQSGGVQERVHFSSSSAAAAAYGVGGTVEDWNRDIGRYCVGNSRLVLAVSAAFAAPLLKPTGNETGGLHLCGGSSIGKSTALHVAGSVCGGGGAGGYTGQWRATANGLEGVAVAHNDGLLVLDEIGQLSGKEVAGAVYMLANERGKSRANKVGDAAATKNWTTMVLSSGELSLSAHATDAGVKVKAGTEVRLLTIPADAGRGRGLYESTHDFASPAALSDHLKSKAKVVYGTPLRHFLRWFVENRDNALSLAASLQEGFRAKYVPANSSGEIVRAAARFSLLAAAGELATDSGATGWEPGEATAAAGVCFKAWLTERDGAMSVGGDVEAGVRQALNIIEQHGARFQQMHQSFETRDRLGFRLEEHGLIKHLVLRGPFESEICKGYNYKAVRDELIRRGYMIPGAEEARPGQQQVRLPGLGKQRVYVMTRPSDEFEVGLAVAA